MNMETLNKAAMNMETLDKETLYKKIMNIKRFCIKKL